jgi:tripartite-type tricarboxylate transporter receptor subunit TctC
VVLGLWRGVAIKRGTDPAIRAAIERIVAKAVADPEFVDSYVRQRSLDIRPGYLSATDFQKSVTNEYQSMAVTLKEK